MSKFANANLKTSGFSTGVKDIGKYTMGSNSSFLYDYNNKQKAKELLLENQRVIDNKFDNINKRKQLSGVGMRSVLEGQKLALVNTLRKEAKNEIFKTFMFEVFYNANVLDEDFKLEHYSNLKNFSDEFIDGKGGYAYLESALAKNPKNLLFKNIKTMCESVSKEVANRKSEEIDRNEGDTSFTASDLSEYERELVKTSYETGIDQISDTVKDKVKHVITNEQERQAREEELVGEIEASLESSVRIERPNVIKEYTLFNAMMNNVAVSLIKENATEEDNDIEDRVDELYDEEEDELNLDLVLAESINWYTMLEVLNTMCLETYNVARVRKLSSSLVRAK